MARFALPDLHAQRRVDALSQVGVLVYQGVTTSEIEEPVLSLARSLDADVVHIGATAEPVVGVEPVRTVHVDMTTDDPAALRSDVLVIPGGLGWQRLADDREVMIWLSHAAKIAPGVLAISTGSLLLASVGRLDGLEATGHWLAQDELAALGANVQTSRTAHSNDRRITTATGALSATEAATELADRVRWGPT